MDMENIIILTPLSIRVNGLKICNMEKDLNHLKTNQLTLGNSNWGNVMASVFFHSQMVHNMKGSLKTISLMDKGKD